MASVKTTLGNAVLCQWNGKSGETGRCDEKDEKISIPDEIAVASKRRKVYARSSQFVRYLAAWQEHMTTG